MIKIFEYVLFKQPEVLVLLKQAGLLTDFKITRRREGRDLLRSEIIELMKHDRWKRVRGAIRQIHGGVVVV